MIKDFGVAMRQLETDAGESAQDVEEVGRKLLLLAADTPVSRTQEQRKVAHAVAVCAEVARLTKRYGSVIVQSGEEARRLAQATKQPRKALHYPARYPGRRK